MPYSKRLLLALLVVLVDLVAFALPLMAMLIAYVIVARPPWFIRAVLQLYDDDEAGRLPPG